MALTKGQHYHFLFGTAAEYATAKTNSKINANDLYFITDTKEVYVGTDKYVGGTIEFVTTFPDAPAQGVVYCNATTHETKYWTGSAWNVIVPAVETAITADTTGTNLANVKAIRDYVAAQAPGEAVKDVAYDANTAELTISYNGSTEAKKINLPKENFLSAASFDAKTNTLTLTLVDNTTVTVDLADLVDTYTVADTNSVDLTLSDEGQITAAVKRSATTGNKLVENEDGLYVAPEYITAVDNTSGNVTLTVADGKLSATATETDLTNYYTKTEVDAFTTWDTIPATTEE